MPSRRDILKALPGLGCGLGLCASAFAAERWADRRPDEWSPSDIQDVLDRSPWVREVTLNSSPTAASQSNGKTARRPGITEFKVTVRWESGLPVRLARHLATLPDKGANRYTISITRMPLDYLTAALGLKSADETKAAVAKQLAETCTIDRDGKESIRAERAYWVYNDFSQRVDIVFPRDKNPVKLDDWEAAISGRAGDFLVRARFSLKQMVFRGELEL
jgi:hypothetical protein